ncbi:gamma-glutamyltranspeptidase / glutathione hydrolase [Nocardioides exalbidus]|uniref:Gamma-glutamyltranspeptidase / glutathione hydrolase n=1 Tax=Nocardioides exalbidus TaxID=402596 RepID=A0A1H4I5M7_9ACTN|nr:gamma-glutamyltransferase [Nocardioides exalbidus]SEB28582.1 gamma-glutamyltranspeptidase / glutathione hydrolase [Nocardioides exalbidus]
MAVAAPNAAAADAAIEVARAGGSAVDAAISAALVAMVNEVGLVSLSSGGFLAVQPATGAAYTVDGWVDRPGLGRGADAPAPLTWDVSTAYGGGVSITVGPGSVATHGSLAAFGEAHRRDGRLPWRELVAPAVDVARDGFRLGAASRYYLQHVHDSVFGWDPASRSALHDDEGGVVEDRVVVADLAATLEHIADVGPRALHEGDLARLIASDVRRRGGLLGEADLAAYEPVVRPPLTSRVGAWQLATTPPPSVGGVVVAAMLRLADGHPTSGWDRRDVEHFVLVQRAVLGHRREVLETAADLDQASRAFLDLVDADHRAVLESGSTAHVSVTDADGSACSLTVSSGYGSGLIAAGTGIWLNNCLGEQELNPPGRQVAAGSRLLSNMAPTVGRHDDGSTLAIGSPGADRITTAIVSALAGFVSGGLSLEAAVAHPRVHVHRAGLPDEEVRVEDELSMYYGGVGAALTRATGDLEAVADPRREGVARILRSTGQS